MTYLYLFSSLIVKWLANNIFYQKWYNIQNNGGTFIP